MIQLEKVPAFSDQREGTNTEHPMDWYEYHSQDDIEAYLDYLSSTYDFVDVESIGQSYEGRPMRVIKACKGGCGNKPAMWIDGGIHAREWISPASVTWMIKEVIENEAAHPTPNLMTECGEKQDLPTTVKLTIAMVQMLIVIGVIIGMMAALLIMDVPKPTWDLRPFPKSKIRTSETSFWLIKTKSSFSIPFTLTLN